MSGAGRPGGVRRIGRGLGRLLGIGAAIWAVTLILVALVSIFWPRDGALPAPADAIVCLGAGMSEKLGWDVPDAASRGRALTCARLQQAGVAPVVIFTGHGNEVTSAAAAMAAVAIEAGLPPGAAIIEQDARSTIQNAAFSRPLLPPDTARVVLVSDAFHLPRASVIFRAFGIDDLAPYATDTAARPATGTAARWVLRESLAIWFNLGRLALYRLAGVVGIDTETRIGWMT